MAKKKESAQDKLINIQAQQLAGQLANWASTLDFQKERFRLLELPEFQQKSAIELDRLAWEKAEATWERSYKSSLLTGMYEGQPTVAWLESQARLTGTLNGVQTLEGKLNDAQISDMQDKMKLANDEFLASTTGYYGGVKTFDREKFEAAQAQDAWKFLATLSGPSNAFRQARAIGSIPGGVGQMMNAWAGTYGLSSSTNVGSGGQAGLAGLSEGFAAYGAGGPPPAPGAVVGTVGGQPAGQTPQTPISTPVVPYVPPPGGQGIPGRGFTSDQWNDATRSAVTAWNAAHPGYTADGSQLGYSTNQPQTPVASIPGYTYSPAGAQAPAGAWNYTPTADGQAQVYPPGVQSPAFTPDVSTNSPVSPTVASSVYQYGGQNTGTSGTGVLSPNQINAENYNNSTQYMRDLGWASFEDQGIDPGLAKEVFERSLPSYTGVTKGAVSF